MSLQSRLSALIQQVGADIKNLFTRVQALETTIDGGGP
jgi:hypothetical protein